MTKPDLQLTTGTGKGDRKRTGMRYNRYGDAFLIDEIQPEEIGEELVNVGELVADEEWQIIADTEHSLQEDYTIPERQIEPRTEQDRKKRYTKLRILEWMHNFEADEKLEQSNQQVDVSATNHVKTEHPCFGWTATDRPLDIPPENLSQAPSTGTSINNFVREVGVGLTHTENLMIKKLRKVREINGLELDQEEAEPSI